MRSLILAAALLAAPAYADLLASNGRDWLRLTQAARTNQTILPMIREEHRASFKAGRAEAMGKAYQACWVDTMEGAYVVFFDDGEIVALPVAAFVEVGI